MTSSKGWQILPPKGDALWQKLALLARPSRPAPPDRWAAENRIYPQTAAVPLSHPSG